MITVLLAVTGVIAPVMLIAGWRGRRVGDEPRCRRCRYDLSGRSDPDRCPECGANLTEPRAVVVGLRRRRPAVISIGLLLLLAGGSTIGVRSYVASRNLDWRSFAPVSVLVFIGEWGDAAAAAELMNRTSVNTAGPFGELSDTQGDRVIQMLLRVQGDASVAWTREWQELAGVLLPIDAWDPADLRRFYEQGVSIVIQTPPRVHADSEFTEWRRRAGGRSWSPRPGGSRTDGPLLVEVERTDVQVDGREIRSWSSSTASFPEAGQSSGSGTRYRAAQLVPDGGPGVRTVTVTRRVRVGVANADGWGLADPPRAEWTREDVFVMEIVPNDVELVTAVPAAACPKLLDTLRVGPVRFQGGEPLVPRGSVMIDNVGIEAGLAVTVSVRFAGQTSVVNESLALWIDPGSIADAHSWGVTNSGRFFSDDPDAAAFARTLLEHAEAGGTVDLILTPNPDAALLEPGMTQMVGDTLIFRGVPVLPPPLPGESSPYVPDEDRIRAEVLEDEDAPAP